MNFVMDVRYASHLMRQAIEAFPSPLILRWPDHVKALACITCQNAEGSRPVFVFDIRDDKLGDHLEIQA